ncbi:MAG: pyruvate kinase [Planctomycetia bacterium]|nr:pyruvate kinase [Planctomycetia bacterium]
MKTPHFHRPSHTKIVATLGPASRNISTLCQLLTAGVDVFRINAAHGNREQFSETLALIRQASAEVGIPVGVLMDLGGPKIRLGTLLNDSLTLHAGDFIRFVPGTVSHTENDLTCTYAPLISELNVGDRVMLADGTVELSVCEKSPDCADWARCKVVEGGTIRSRQGVNLPGVKLSIPAMLDVDRENAAWAAKNEIDFLGLSFVRHAGEIEDLRNLIRENSGCCQIVAKIEKPEAVENLESIVAAADAIMVARGDLGVETDIALVPMLQKEIIRVCHRYRKPVIVATQMLESMTHNNFPTRAEVTDVANAILDGADACMLSGETAVGDFPVTTVNMMHRIALGTENAPRNQENLPPFESLVFATDPITAAACRSACTLAKDVGAKCIIVVSHSGATAKSLSQNRPSVPILGLTHKNATLRRMCLYWGVIPVQVPEEISEPDTILDFLVAAMKKRDLLRPGDRLILLAGTKITDQHNALLVHEIS